MREKRDTNEERENEDLKQTRRRVEKKKHVRKEGLPRKDALRLKNFVVSSDKVIRYEVITDRTIIASQSDTRLVPCESVLTEAKNEITLRGKSGQHWCALIGGSCYDYEAINTCLEKFALKTQRCEIDQEQSWLKKVSDHVHQPVGTP